MDANQLLLLGTVGCLIIMLILITYHNLRGSPTAVTPFEEEWTTFNYSATHLPAAMYPHNEFMQLTAMPFISEQPAALQLAG